MSYTVTLNPPVDPTTPEGKAYYHGLTYGAAGQAAQIPPELLAAVPSIPTGMYGFFGGTLPRFANWASGKLGYGLNIPQAPGVETANAITQGIHDVADTIIPTKQLVPAENQDQQMLFDTTGALAGVVPMPGALAARLPSAINKAVAIAAPPAKHLGEVAAIGAGLTGGAEDYIAHQQPTLVQLDDQGNPVQAAPQAPAVVSPTASPTAASTGLGLVSSAQAAETPPAAQLTQLDENGNPVTQQQPAQQQGATQSDSGTPFWQTGAEILGGGLAAWAGIKHGPRILNRVVDALEHIEKDPAVVSQIMDDIRMGRPAPAVTPEMPLPNNASGLTRRWARAGLNPNAILNELSRGIAANSDEAEAMISKNNQMNYPAGQSRQMESQFRTGTTPTGFTGPSQYDAKILVDAMTPDQQRLADNAAWMRSELDVRRTTGDKVWFPGMTDRQLMSEVTRAQADPLISAYLDHISATAKFIPDDMERMGLITSQEANRMRRTMPNFMPTFDTEGNLLHSWEGRNVTPGSGFDLPPIKAWDAQSAYYSKVYNEANNNAFKQYWVNKLEQFVRANPEYRGLINEAPSGSTARQTISFNDGNRGRRSVDINNTYLRDSLKNPAQMQLNLATGGGLRRFFQSTVTGPLSLVGGNVFAAKNFLRDVVQIPAQAPKGYRTGVLWGGRLPIYDPTFITQSGYTAARDTGAVLAKAFADALTSKNHPFTQVVRGLSGGRGVTAMRDWLNQRYLNSQLEFRQSLGVGGGGAFGSHEMSNRVAGRSENLGTYRDPLANTVAPLVARPGLAQTKVPLGKGAITSYLNLRQLIHDIHGVISDAPHSAFFDMNINNPHITRTGHPDALQRLAGVTQQLIGDPGTRGVGSNTRLGKASLWADTNLPYFNISKQAVGAAARSFRDHPLTWGGTMASATMMGVLASQLSALSSGKEHVQHLENRVSNAQKESNYILYHGPGTDPNQHTEISASQEQRFLIPVMHEILGSFLNTWKAHESEPTLERLKYALANVFSHHTSVDTNKQVALGLTDLLGFPLQFTPGQNVAMTGAGSTGTVNVGQQVVQNLLTGKPLTNGLIATNDLSKLPGQEGSPGYLAKNDWKYISSLLSAFGGTAGSALAKYADSASARYSQTHDLDWVRHGFWTDVAQQGAERNAYGNIVWGKTLPQSTRGAVDERISNVMDNIKAAATAATDAKLAGFTRNKGQQTLVVNQPPGPGPQGDATMQRMWQTMGQFSRAMDSRLMPQINDIYRQMQVTRDSAYTADEKTRILNNYTEQLHAKKMQLSGEIDKLNHALSYISGRHVDVSKRIDWKGDITQFPLND